MRLFSDGIISIIFFCPVLQVGHLAGFHRRSRPSGPALPAAAVFVRGRHDLCASKPPVSPETAHSPPTRPRPRHIPAPLGGGAAARGAPCQPGRAPLALRGLRRPQSSFAATTKRTASSEVQVERIRSLSSPSTVTASKPSPPASRRASSSCAQAVSSGLGSR